MRRVGHWLTESLLWIGAVLGVVSIIIAVLAAMGDVRPLVFRSSSMEPAISTGALAFSHRVDADEIAVGDIVSVTRGDGMRVTHRVVGTVPADPGALLTLKGDANPVNDAEVYSVESAYRVVFDVPWVGYVVTAVEGPWVGAVFVVLLVALLGSRMTRQRRRGPRRGGSRRAPGRRSTGGKRRATTTAVVMLVGAGLVVSTTRALPTMAAFTDVGTLTSGTLTAGTVASPSTAATPCSANNPVLGTNTVTVRWNGVNTTSPAPASAYEYLITAYDRSTNAPVGTALVDHQGAAGAVQSQQYTAGLLGSLLGLDLVTLLAGQQLRVEFKSRLKGTSWVGATVISVNFKVVPVLQTFSCS